MTRLSAALPCRRSRTALLSTAAALVLIFAAAPATWAATVESDGQTVKFTAAPGEVNDVTGNASPEFGFLEFSDAGAPLTAGPGCTDLGDVVRCDGVDAQVRVFDGADRVRLEHFGLLTTIWGGDGDDDIHGGSGAGSTTVHGEAGDDVLSTSNNGGDAIVTGGVGDDQMTIGEATGGYFAGGKGDDHIVYLSIIETFFARGARQAATQPIIDGGSGDDLIEASLLDPEAIDGGQGDDTLRYSGFGRIDLQVSDLETVILVSDSHEVFGSRHGDRIVSLAGPETISALGGRDSIDVRNGTVDTVDCGRGFDVVQADPDDSIAPNCELVL